MEDEAGIYLTNTRRWREYVWSRTAEARIPAGPLRSARSRLVSWAAVGLLFSLALGVRLVRVSEPPLDFNPTRQYHSALLARRIYFAVSREILMRAVALVLLVSGSSLVIRAF